MCNIFDDDVITDCLEGSSEQIHNVLTMHALSLWFSSPSLSIVPVSERASELADHRHHIIIIIVMF